MMRDIIGPISIGIGILLLIVSLYLTLRRIRARSEKPVGRAALATVIYGLLFIAVGMVIQYTEPTARGTSRFELSAPVAIPPPDTVRARPRQAIADSIQLSERIGESEQQKPSIRREGKTPARPLRTKERIQPAPSRWTPEDRIYASVDAVLRKIEEFFDRYGTPDGMQSSPLLSLRLQPIFFDDTTADIPVKYLPLLDETARRIRQYTGTDVIEVQAHTNGEGPEVYNFLITQSRANAARDYLIARGVAPERLVAKGYGTTMPRPATSDSTKTRSNRRIEFVPLSEMRTVQK